jgi:hypothetical protein
VDLDHEIGGGMRSHYFILFGINVRNYRPRDGWRSIRHIRSNFWNSGGFLFLSSLAVNNDFQSKGSQGLVSGRHRFTTAGQSLNFHALTLIGACVGFA